MARNNSIAKKIEAAVVHHYSTSGGFNGMHVDQLRNVAPTHPKRVDTAIRRLIEAGRLDAVFGDRHPNPAIKALPAEPISVQLEKFSSGLGDDAWIYPTPQSLRTKVKPGAHRGRPYTRRLARGEHQFSFDAFDPMILYTYRDDPRYLYHNSDFGGWISIRDEFYESGVMYDRDEVLLRSFGFCFNERGERVVAALLYDLSGLSPQHQQNWNNRRLKGDFQLHPMYWRWVCGEWPNGHSIFSAVVQEIKVINRLSERMGKPCLFGDEFDERPDRFTFLLNPTQEEYNSFAQVLDKIVVENMQERFFDGDIEPFLIHQRSDGTVERERKRPIAMLAEWLDKYYVLEGGKRDEVIQTLREIRRQRNKPAHVLLPNTYDPTLFDRQRELMIRVYKSLKLLRQLFQADEDCAEFNLPRFVDDGSRIWTR